MIKGQSVKKNNKKYGVDDLENIEFSFTIKFKNKIFHSQYFTERWELISVIEQLTPYRKPFNRALCKLIKDKFRKFLEYKII